jgi:DNA-directed RNA polymerase specialized sigma24 family protein
MAVPIDEGELPVDANADLILDIDQALSSLAALDPRLVRIVECRFFAGMTDQEAATALDVSERTIRREWIKARTWLHERFGPPEDGGSPGATGA